ncbi:MAG: diguanylate cyclase [Pseudomonadota bacterium]|nr:diguanylate cyclase [Pseudomonadota bacterium]
MTKQSVTRRKGAIRSPLKANRRVPSPASTAANTFAEREAALLAGEQTVDRREEVADRREEVADRREEVADQREEVADQREEIADCREQVAALRDKALRAQEEAARDKAELNAQNQAQLREANEHLVLATVHAQTMTEAAEQAAMQMSYMAKHDFLTGLPNRSLLTDRLAQSMALAQRYGKKVALLYLDLDRFKHINDSLGHTVGDQLLQSVAQRLQACVRVSDTVCRQGGDEFVVLLAEVHTLQDVCLTAEKLIKAMAEPHLIDAHWLHVTLSIGISLYPDHGQDVETVVQNADSAMYHAKQSGRNTYRVFTQEMNVRAVTRHSVEETLRRALEQHEFVLHYQPKVNLATGVITGAEALIRLQQAHHRLIGPEQFVSIAEDSGLILPMGQWVLRETCRQMAVWLQAGLDISQIAINVSAVEFHGKNFLAGVRAILNDTGMDPHYLEFEMTESGLMPDTELTTSHLHALKELGVQIAVDDFGTGYSSLSYLRRFPIDTLKIDQSFVRELDGNAGDAIVSAVIAIGMSLKQRVVAEGIETPQQLAFLQSHHCAEGQGFFFSRPVTADAFATLLETGIRR